MRAPPLPPRSGVRLTDHRLDGGKEVGSLDNNSVDGAVHVAHPYHNGRLVV